MAVIDFGITVATEPTSEPITLAEAKAWLRVLHTDEDSVIANLITQAREAVEVDSRRSLMTQTLDVFFDGWPRSTYFELFRGPIQSISFIKYYTTDGTLTTWSSSNYTLDAPRNIVQIVRTTTMPSLQDVANAVNIRYVAGYAAASSVPQGLKHAMMLMIGLLYGNRTSDPQDRRLTVDESAYWSLVNKYRIRSYP